MKQESLTALLVTATISTLFFIASPLMFSAGKLDIALLVTASIFLISIFIAAIISLFSK